MAKSFGVVDEENGIAWPAVFVIGKDRRIAWRSISETYTKRPSADELLGHLDAAGGLPPRNSTTAP